MSFFHRISWDATKLSQKDIVQMCSPDWENKEQAGKEMVSYQISCTSQLWQWFQCQNVPTTEIIVYSEAMLCSCMTFL